VWRGEPTNGARARLRALLASAIVAGGLLRIRRRRLELSRPIVRGALAAYGASWRSS